MIRALLPMVILMTTLAAPVASAQELSGALGAGPVIADGDVGGGGWVDLWAAFDWFRIGGFTGAITIPSSRDARNRLATPLALSIAAVANLGDVDLEVRARGGMWGGATQEVKLTAGGFVGGAVFLDFHLGGGASLGGGVEIWGILGAGETWAIAPSLTLTFGPPPPTTPDRTTSAGDFVE
jgi:hypothetical protein